MPNATLLPLCFEFVISGYFHFDIGAISILETFSNYSKAKDTVGACPMRREY